MSLSSLPPELIALILSAAMPDVGFEPLMLSCKTVYNSGTLLLQRHNFLRRTYSHIVADDETFFSTIALLLRVARDPTIAEYIEDVDLWNQASLPLSIDILDEHSINNTDFQQEISAVVTRSARMYALDVDERTWLDQLVAEIKAKGSALLCSLTLLTLLPNLRSLTPTSHWSSAFDTDNGPEHEASYWRKLMDSLIARANGSYEGAKPFNNLSLVRPCFEQGYSSSMDLQMLNPLMALPTVTTMSLSGCKAVDDGYTGHPFQWQYPLYGSNIRRLELAYCCMDGLGLAQALQYMPQLRILRYSHETKWHGCLHDWDIGAFIGHIGKWCGGSLTELSVTMPALFGDTDGAAPFLKQFTALEALELELRSLKTHQSLIEVFRDDELPPTPAIQPKVPLSSADAEYTLADILPSSTKSLQLILNGSDDEYTLMQRLLTGSQTHLLEEMPKLARIHLSRYCEAMKNEDARWIALGETIPSTIDYSYNNGIAGPAWHSGFFHRYPHVMEQDDGPQ